MHRSACLGVLLFCAAAAGATLALSITNSLVKRTSHISISSHQAPQFMLVSCLQAPPSPPLGLLSCVALAVVFAPFFPPFSRLPCRPVSSLSLSRCFSLLFVASSAAAGCLDPSPGSDVNYLKRADQVSHQTQKNNKITTKKGTKKK